MKKNRKNEYNPLNLNMIFVLMVFIILLGTIGLLVGAVYLFRALGIIQFVSVEIPGWLFVLILTVSSLVLGLVISYFMSKFVFKASNRIVEGLEKLASGDFNERVYLGNSKAHVQLSNAFNKLAKELEDTKMLRADFVNEFAHEFKTPIVSIKGFAELLVKDGVTIKQREEYINIIIEESTRLADLAHNYLALTKIEKQNILTDLVEFNLSEQVRSSLLLLEAKWSKKNLDPVFYCDEVSIVANEEMLKQVWINIIDNAIKFSNPQSELSVSIELGDDDVRIIITNKGEEIPEQERVKIFDKFYRAQNSKGVEGNGVGLAIVKKIVELHKGSVYIESENEHTSFIVVLPKANKIVC